MPLNSNTDSFAVRPRIKKFYCCKTTAPFYCVLLAPTLLVCFVLLEAYFPSISFIYGEAALYIEE